MCLKQSNQRTERFQKKRSEVQVARINFVLHWIRVKFCVDTSRMIIVSLPNLMKFQHFTGLPGEPLHCAVLPAVPRGVRAGKGGGHLTRTKGSKILNSAWDKQTMYHNLPSNPNEKTVFHLEYVYTLKLWMQSNDSKGVHFTLVPQVYCLLFDQNQ